MLPTIGTCLVWPTGTGTWLHLSQLDFTSLLGNSKKLCSFVKLRYIAEGSLKGFPPRVSLVVVRFKGNRSKGSSSKGNRSKQVQTTGSAIGLPASFKFFFPEDSLAKWCRE